VVTLDWVLGDFKNRLRVLSQETADKQRAVSHGQSKEPEMMMQFPRSLRSPRMVVSLFAPLLVISASRALAQGGPGSLDAGFTASADGGVGELSLQPDGKVLVGGQFTTVNGVARTTSRGSTPMAALIPVSTPRQTHRCLRYRCSPMARCWSEVTSRR
jgi:hypothetical protein